MRRRGIVVHTTQFCALHANQACCICGDIHTHWNEYEYYNVLACISTHLFAGFADDAGNEPSTSSSGAGGAGGAADPEASRQALERLFRGGGGALTGPELTSLIRSKWGGRSFEARLAKRGSKMYLHVSHESVGRGRVGLQSRRGSST